MVRFHPGAPNVNTLLALLVAFTLGIFSSHYLEQADLPPAGSIEAVVVENVADIECGTLFEVVDFKNVAHVKEGAVYRGIISYGLKVSLGPLPVGLTPTERREYSLCITTAGMGLIQQGYKDGDVISLVSNIELWKVDNTEWLLHSFEAEQR